MRLIVCDEREVTGAERAACESLWERTWPTPPDFVPDPARVNTSFLRVLLYDSGGAGDAGALAGACALLEREITVDGRPRRIAGLQGVVVEEAHRGRGHGRRVVEAAMAEARARG